MSARLRVLVVDRRRDRPFPLTPRTREGSVPPGTPNSALTCRPRSRSLIRVATQPSPEISVNLKQFFESVAPGRKVRLVESFRLMDVPEKLIGTLPGIALYCGTSSCERIQNFSYSEIYPLAWHQNKTGDFHVVRTGQDVFARYYCRNCNVTWKTFAFRIYRDDAPNLAKVYGHKFGEIPQFGPPLPAKLLQLAGDYGDLLRKGRQSENQSLGIGAFAYYRRVVELQKLRLIDELQKAIERLGGNNGTALAALEQARSENQFTRALELMADVTPRELYVSGQNPLKLVHGPLSVGLHGLSDEECQKQAHSIRVVLGALLERILMVTEEKDELDAAIKDLLPAPTKNSE
jgi:hypothetical protein